MAKFSAESLAKPITQWCGPNPCEYPSFVRHATRITPYWKNWEVGERKYAIAHDEFIRCIKPFRTLEARCEAVPGESDSGQSPSDLGYVAVVRDGDVEYWERDSGQR